MSEVRYRSQLRQLLTTDDLYFERFSFIEILLASTLPITMQLQHILEGNSLDDVETLTQAVHTVADLRMNDFTPILLRLFDKWSISFFQTAILYALSVLEHEQINSFLLSVVLNKQVGSMRGIALGGLQKKWPQMVAPLLALVQDTSDEPYLRGGAMRTLVEQDEKSILPIALSLLGDPEAPVRYEAVNAVGILGDRSLKPHLEALLKDTDNRVTWAVQMTLQRWTSEEINQNKSL